jgi:acyl-CoA thioesterase
MNALEPGQIVAKMLEKDQFSHWLGIDVMEVSKGHCRLEMKIREDMTNGFGIAHGGISFSVADSALAFASNAGGRKSVSIETSISHLISLHVGDHIVVEANCESETEKLGHYHIKIFKKDLQDRPVALFKGIVYRTGKMWE